MKSIPISRGKYFTIIDDEDFERVNQYKWQFTGRYVIRTCRINGKQKCISLHRFILNAPFNKEVDHLNHDCLDNRKANLRFCTHSQNLRNQQDIKGYYYNKRDKRYIVYLSLNNKNKYIGSYKTPDKASIAYKEAVKPFL